LKKRVSFESNSAVNGINGLNGATTPPDEISNVDPSPEQLGLLRPKPSSNSTTRTDSAAPLEQVKNNELAIVEEEPAASNVPLPVIHSQKDQVPQEYWMEPSKQEIESMSRTQRQKVTNFTVGRKGVGKVRFNPPVDLTSINLDTLCGGLIVLDIRLCTVYPNGTPKPARGSGLNVPSTISLENSWPRRGKDLHVSSAKMKKHIDGLKKVKDTKFVEYDKDTGVWTFTVEHFTTYGFPDDDEMDEDYDDFGQSTLSAPPDSPSPNERTPTTHQMDESFGSTSQRSRTESDPDDTFQFRRKKVLPGAFDEHEVYVDEAENDYEEREESFLDDGSVGSPSGDGVEPMEQEDTPYDEESVSIMDQEMAGSYPHAGNTTELDGDSQDEDYGAVDGTPGALVRARTKGGRTTGTPHQSFVADNDWTNALRNTVSPKKQDRALLKSLADIKRVKAPEVDVPIARRVVSDGRGFANSIDLMNSLFGTTRSPTKQSKVPAIGKGFEVGFPVHA
jgi:nuclear pore complex protein Nup98-Nup96